MPRFRPHPLSLALAGALALGSLAAQAQSPQSPQAAGAAAPLQLHVAAQPLAQALNDLARQARLELIVQPALVAGRSAPAVSGLLTPRQALDQLLAGSGLVAVIEGAAVTVQRAGAAPASGATLPQVRVTATAERSATTEQTGSYTTRQAGTATPLGLSLRETPQSVSVMTRQRIEDQGLTQLTDVAQQTPGLTVAMGGNAGSDSSPIYARGFTVETYMVDGVRLLDSGYTTRMQTNDMAMYDRVEVVRGASGLMNGMGTPGAAINLMRKRPTADFQGQAHVEAGSWNHRRAEVDVGGALNAARTVRARLVAALQDNDSYIDRLQEKKKVLYGIVEADLAPQTLLSAGASVQHHDATGHARGGLPAYYSDGTRTQWRRSDSAAPAWAYSDRHYSNAFAELQHAFNDDWKLRASASRSWNDYDEVVGYASGGNPVRATGAGVTIWASRWQGKPVQDVGDLQLTGRFDALGRKHDVALGVQMSRTHHVSPAYTNWYHTGWSSAIDDIYTWDGTSPAAPPNPSVGTYGSDERLNSAYATLRFKASDALALLAGARVVDWSRYQPSLSYATGETTVTDRRETGQVVPYAGLVYDIDSHWSAYTSYTSIFKPQNSKLANGDYLDPQTGDSFELGVKGAFFNERLNVAAALYKARQDNLAVAIPDVFAPDGSQAYEAVSGTSTRGFEAEVSGELRPGWQLAAGFSRNLTRDRTKARLLTNVPQNNFKLFTSYRIAGVGRGLTVGGGVRWQSRIYADNQGPAKVRFEQGGYALVDLMARYAVTDSVAVTANLSNAFDKWYYNTTGNAYYGTPRALRVALDVRF
jgi:outer membrane receptor for ferric coprogen and ferric-rhodotorulic acid